MPVVAAPFARTWPTFRPDAAFRPTLPNWRWGESGGPPSSTSACRSSADLAASATDKTGWRRPWVPEFYGPAHCPELRTKREIGRYGRSFAFAMSPCRSAIRPNAMFPSWIALPSFQSGLCSAAIVSNSLAQASALPVRPALQRSLSHPVQGINADGAGEGPPHGYGVLLIRTETVLEPPLVTTRPGLELLRLLKCPPAMAVGFDSTPNICGVWNEPSPLPSKMETLLEESMARSAFPSRLKSAATNPPA